MIFDIIVFYLCSNKTTYNTHSSSSKKLRTTSINEESNNSVQEEPLDLTIPTLTMRSQHIIYLTMVNKKIHVI